MKYIFLHKLLDDWYLWFNIHLMFAFQNKRVAFAKLVFQVLNTSIAFELAVDLKVKS